MPPVNKKPDSRGAQEAGATIRQSKDETEKRGRIPEKGSIVFVMDDAEIERGSLAVSRRLMFQSKMSEKKVHCVPYTSFFDDPTVAVAEFVILDSTRLFEGMTNIRDTWGAIITSDIPASQISDSQGSKILQNRRRLKQALEAFREDESFREDGSRSVIFLSLFLGQVDEFEELLNPGLVDAVERVTTGRDANIVEECERIRQSGK
jgi:hypothetical protein